MNMTNLLLLYLLYLAVASGRILHQQQQQELQQANGTGIQGDVTTTIQSCGVPFAFLHKTHTATDRFVEAARRAKQQVERCGGYYRVLYIVLDPHKHPDAARDVTALQLAVGNQSVIALGPADFSVTFGKEWESGLSSETFGGLGPWAWVHSDAPEVVWYALFSRDLPASIQHVWASEYDVAWTGDLPATLAPFPPDADFICYTDFKPDGLDIGPRWQNFRAHTWLKDEQVRQCFLMLARYSLRFLQTLLAHTRLGHRQFGEITGASICGVVHASWCRVYPFGEHHPVVGRDPATKKVLFRFSVKLSPEEWRAVVASEADPARGHLFHALKWRRL